MSTNPEISIVIPTYNEKKNIGLLLDELTKQLNGSKFEIIVVDDHSSDGTMALLQRKSKADERVKFLPHPPPRSLSSSILLGIRSAKGKIVVGMDADFNHDPTIIKSLIHPLRRSGADLVIASRFINGGGMENFWRFMATKLFNLLLRSVFSFPSTDNASGYYAIKTKLLLSLPLEKIFVGYGEYHLRLVYLAKVNGFLLREIPVFYQKRLYGESKSRLLHMLVSYLKVAYQLRFQS